MSGEYSSFFDSEEDKPKDNKEISIETVKSGRTQIELVADGICSVFKEFEKNNSMKLPYKVFQQPLPTQCYFDYDWDNPDMLCGKVVELKRKV